jgi:hypothetical protein
VKIKATLIALAAGLTVLPAFGQEEFTQKQEVTALGFSDFLRSTTSNESGTMPKILGEFWPAIVTSSTNTMALKLTTRFRTSRTDMGSARR